MIAVGGAGSSGLPAFASERNRTYIGQRLWAQSVIPSRLGGSGKKTWRVPVS